MDSPVYRLQQALNHHKNGNETMKDTVILVTNNGMGNAEPALQHKLAAKYFEIIAQNTSLPVAICFYTEGVKLIVTGSPVLKQLKALEEKGVRLIICST